MPGVYKKAYQRAKPGGKYTVWWTDANGLRRYRVALADKSKSESLAAKLQHEADLVRLGLVEPKDASAKAATTIKLERHIADYTSTIRDKGATTKHYEQIESTLTRVFAEAGISRLPEITEDRLRPTLATWARKKSARTANHALGASRAFTRWAERVGRLKIDTLRGMSERYNEEADRKRVRRAITPDQLRALIAATEAGPSLIARRPMRSKHLDILIDGPERAVLYRLAMGTGFRANELALLTPEDFRLDGDNPRIEIDGSRTKNGKAASQPIRKELAEFLRPWIAGKSAGEPAIVFPVRTAEMLRVDLEAAGIPYRDERGQVLDFHAIRVSFLSAIGKSGCDPKTMMELARHADFKTTQRYLRSDDGDKRKALGE